MTALIWYPPGYPEMLERRRIAQGLMCLLSVEWAIVLLLVIIAYPLFG